MDPATINWVIAGALFFLIFFSIRQRWPERFVRWVRSLKSGH